MNRIELYYDITMNINSICTKLLWAWCHMIWVRPFMPNKKKAWIIGAVYAATMLILDFIPLPINAILYYSIGALAACLVMCQIDRECIAQKLFLVVTFFCMRWQSGRIMSSISNEIQRVSYQLFSSTDSIFWFWELIILFVWDDLLMFLLMYGAIRCLHWSYGDRREHINAREFLLLVIPSMTGVLAYGVIRYYNYIYERDAGKSAFDLYISHNLIILLYSAACFVTIFVTTYVFRQWKTEQEEDKQREVFLSQMQDLEKHITEVERIYNDMRSLRHDIGNHLMTLDQLYILGEYETAGKYAEALKCEMQQASFEVGSGNPVTDVILSDRKKEMKEKKISFFCDFHYPVNGEVNAFDISIILNNGLSNAIEGIERDRMLHKEDAAVYGMHAEQNDEIKSNCEIKGEAAQISLSSYQEKNIYIIEMINNYRGFLETDARSGLPVSTKKGEGHGFGLTSIRHAARKYLGDIEIGKEQYKNEERFVLRVMLQITKP